MEFKDKEAINNSYCIELEVKDSWQIPAIYKVYKKDSLIETTASDFIKECSEEEYIEVLERIKELAIEKWEGNYELPRDAKKEDRNNLSWKLVIYHGEGKKIIKRGLDAYPDEFDMLEEILISCTEEKGE